MLIRRSRGSVPPYVPPTNITFDDQSFDFISTVSSSFQIGVMPSGCTFSTSDTMPSGFTLSSDGLLSYDGTPFSTGLTDIITVTASKDGFESATASISIRKKLTHTIRFAAGVDTTLYLRNTNGVFVATPSGSWGGTGYHEGIRNSGVSLYPKHGLKYSIDGGFSWSTWCFEDTNSTLDLTGVVNGKILSMTKVFGRNSVTINNQTITVSDPNNGSSLYVFDVTMLESEQSDSSSSGGGIPTDYVFYAPLSTNLDDISAQARTGTAIDSDASSVASNVVKGDVTCTYIPQNARVTYPIRNVMTGYGARTLSLWFYPSHTRTLYNTLLSYGQQTNYGLFACGIRESWKYGFTAYYNDLETNVVASEAWHNLTCSYDGVCTLRLYADGVLIGLSYTLNINTLTSNIYLGGRPYSNSVDICENAWYRNFRIYNRTLSQDEISEIASENLGDA